MRAPSTTRVGPLPGPYTSAGAKFRNRRIGFVFQDFGLIEDETATRNVAVPLRLAGVRARKAEATARNLLDAAGMTSASDAQVSRLSAGQRQRTAFVRALANDPAAILADEPTGNLDPDNRDLVASMLRQSAEAGRCVIVATHDEQVWQHCDRVIRLKDGRIVEG